MAILQQSTPGTPTMYIQGKEVTDRGKYTPAGITALVAAAAKAG